MASTHDKPTGFINNESDEEEIYDSPTAVTDLIETLIDSYKYEKEENLNLSMEEFMCSDNCCYELSEIVDRLNQCYCCKRHQTDRPKKLDRYIETEHKLSISDIHRLMRNSMNNHDYKIVGFGNFNALHNLFVGAFTPDRIIGFRIGSIKGYNKAVKS